MRRSLLTLGLLLVGLSSPARAEVFDVHINGAPFSTDAGFGTLEGGVLDDGTFLFDTTSGALAGSMTTTAGSELGGTTYTVGLNTRHWYLFADLDTLNAYFAAGGLLPGQTYLYELDATPVSDSELEFLFVEVACSTTDTDCNIAPLVTPIPLRNTSFRPQSRPAWHCWGLACWEWSLLGAAPQPQTQVTRFSQAAW
jgi:hypothetical protein